MTNSSLTGIRLFAISIFVFAACGEQAPYVNNTYVYQPPNYDSVQISYTNDTIRFPLDASTYKEIRSFNVFEQDAVHYISFYDRRSESINIYHFINRGLVKRISLKQIFNNRQLVKTSVYVKNFDSIFITNKTKLFMFDSAGNKRKSIAFIESPEYAWPVFENDNLPVVKNTSLFAIVRPNVNYKSLSDLSKWRVLCQFNLETGKATLHYGLPEFYRKNLYGYQFLDYNFSCNNHGRYVFSFPADTLLYETDLINYHKSYYAKSQYQQSVIAPVSRKDLARDAGLEAYVTRDSYGPVYFDPYKQYYLRLAKQKLSEQEFLSKSRKRKQTVLIFNEHFKIVGETEISNDISLESIFPGPDGYLYGRVNFTDDYAIDFLRFNYSAFIKPRNQFALQ